jgi:hypothetical protein
MNAAASSPSCLFVKQNFVASKLRLRLVLSLAPFLISLSSVYAQTTYDWLNTAPDGNWKQGASGAARWNPGGLWDEPPSGGGTILRFNNDRFTTMTNNVSSYSVHQLIFGSFSAARSISGNALTFFDNAGNDPKIENLSTATQTISLNITGDSNDSLQLNPVSGDLTVSGTINNNGSFIDVFGNNTKWLRLEGVVSGAGGLAVKQNSTVVIKADMTYTGDTILEAGFMNLGEGGTAGSLDSRVKLATGTILTVKQNSSIAGVSENGVGNAGTVSIDSGKTLTINGNDQGTLQQSSINGDGGLTLSAAGNTVLRLYGNNQYTGATTITDGTIELAGTAGTGGLTQTASVSVSDSGILLLASSNQVRDAAAVSLSGGTIQRGNGVSETFGALVLNDNSTLNFGAGTTTGSLNFDSYTGNSKKLNVTNFLQGNVLTFKTDLSGSINNTSLFGFDNGFTSNWNIGTGTFTITAIPEPSTYAAAAGLLAMFLWPVRRRVIKDVKSILGLRPTGRERIEAYRKA